MTGKDRGKRAPTGPEVARQAYPAAGPVQDRGVSAASSAAKGSGIHQNAAGWAARGRIRETRPDTAVAVATAAAGGRAQGPGPGSGPGPGPGAG